VLVTSKRSDCRSGTIAGASILAIETAALDENQRSPLALGTLLLQLDAEVPGSHSKPRQTFPIETQAALVGLEPAAGLSPLQPPGRRYRFDLPPGSEQNCGAPGRPAGDATQSS
jgi:hypothetical protein